MLETLGNNIMSNQQEKIRKEFSETYNLHESQISFENDSIEPIFDYDALCVLRLLLTDICHVEYSVEERNETQGIVTIKCRVVLSDGRSMSVLESALIGEMMPSGQPIETIRQAQNVAQARALRRGIRSVGVNFMKAHKQFMLLGETQKFSPDKEFQSSIGKEVLVLATEWGHIKGKEKTAYQDFIERIYGAGKRSLLDLVDIQRSQLANMYRSMLKARKMAISG